MDTFTAGSIDGGQATGEFGLAWNAITISGDVGRMSVGSISGGTADGTYSFAMLDLSIDELLADDGSVLQEGDLGHLNASSVTSGAGTNGGSATLNINIAHNLVNASIGQIVGSGNSYSLPSCTLNVGNDIAKLVAGTITAGHATGDFGYASVYIAAGNDIVLLAADAIDAGSADGDFSTAEVRVTAGRDIQSITANTFSGGQAVGADAMAGLYVDADRNIGFIGAGLISGTTARRIAGPTVQFTAGGDIGRVLAGQITGGTVNADGTAEAQASVLIRADGTYVDENGVQSEGNIGRIVAGTIDGGTANGEYALSYVRISAAHDIDRLDADTISGGQANDGGFAYVSIVAEHDINLLQAGTISGAGVQAGGDSAVLIQAYNDIVSFTAQEILAGPYGNVSILAGLGADGNVSGELDAEGNLVAGSIERMVVGLISGEGGIVNIAAGGDIEYLKASRVVSGDGEVNIVAGGDLTARVGSVQSWELQDETGVTFSAGGAVNDLRNSIKDEYTQGGLGDAVVFPAPPDLPQ